MPHLRTLGARDRDALEAFLGARPDTTMILRSNLGAAGLVDGGRPLEGTYVGAFDGGRLVGVAASYWNGNVAVEAEDDVARIVRAASEASGRPVAGLLGEAGQVAEALAGLPGLASATFDSLEVLYALDLDDLVVPDALVRGEVAARHPREDEDERLVEWRLDYVAEAMGAARTAAVEASAREWIVRMRERRQSWVLESGGEPVCFTGFNAVAPDAVQVGGVWTPPALRGRGYARAAVAASLLEARAGGAARGLLFTDRGNAPARRCYERLGFTVVGAYRVVLAG